MPVIAAIDGLEVAPQSHLDVEPRPADLHHRGSLVAVHVVRPGHLAPFADRAALQVCRPRWSAARRLAPAGLPPPVLPPRRFAAWPPSGGLITRKPAARPD